MVYGRSYKIPFSVAAAGVVDLASGLVASGKYAEFTGFTVNDVDAAGGLPTSQQLSISAFLLTGSITGRSGGTTPTPQPDDPGDTAATTTAHAGDTTVTAGTQGAYGFKGGCYVTQGIDKTFDPPIPALAGEVFVLKLMAAPSGTVTLAGTLNFVERGG